MMRRLSCLLLPLSLALAAQDTQDVNLLSTLKSSVQQTAPAAPVADPLPSRPAAAPVILPDEARRLQQEEDRLDQEVRRRKAAERAPRRFAEDLFDLRQRAASSTEGGIAEDYVLGTGDRLSLNVFGSATFEVPVQVDGRGVITIPKVGTAKVAGQTLARARATVQGLVNRNFSNTTVDLSVLKLREVRVFVLGEVYQPGGYLVPSLSSLVNVLGLAGGPTAAGSFRQIRVLRGGQVVHTLDLYPLRAEGLGNLNVSLQSGDTVFVPLAFNGVRLEGAFTRVVAATGDLLPADAQQEEDPAAADLTRQIRQEEARLDLPAPARLPQPAPKASAPAASSALPAPAGPAAEEVPAELSPSERTALEAHLASLRRRLKALSERQRGDHRIPADWTGAEDASSEPAWLTRWQLEGRVPSLQFELLPGETAADALRFAGGLAAEAFAGNLVLRRLDASGAAEVLDLPTGALAATVLQRGDVLSALPRKDRLDRAVEVRGWVRVPGLFARPDGLRVGQLLKREDQVLPDTYLPRGEILRTLPDGTTRYLAFDVAKALAGDPGSDLPLANRDRVELYRTQDLRIPRTVSVTGPVTRPGTFPFHEGMRAADLLFQAGVPQKHADRYVAELAHTREGRPSEVHTLDLARLLSSDQASPVTLADDALNPPVEPFDQLNIYARPDYRAHRVVTLSGQVARPGNYVLDQDHANLRDLLARAGGLTEEAMPQAGVFLRQVGLAPEQSRANELLGLDKQDPTSNGVNDILKRLAETKRQPSTGLLLRTPLFHALETGALNRMVVNLPAVLAGDPKADVELQDGDQIIIPRKTDAAYVVGETASPFAVYKVQAGMTVKELLALAGGTTRNADTWNIRLLKADGRILDSRVARREVEPGDAVLVPQRVRRDSSWQENLAALTPLAILLNVFK